MTTLSVVMPVYNAEPFLAAAIESILRQTLREFEFVMVDDGSTDGSAKIMKAYAGRDRRIRVISIPHQGHTAAGNAAVAAAEGAWIARMDADDIAHPARLAIQLRWAKEHGLDACGAGFVLRFGGQSGLLWFAQRHGEIERELLFRVGLLHPTMMFRADVAKAFPYRASGADDYDQQVRLSADHRLGNVPMILAQHRCHPAQAHVTKAVQFMADKRVARHRHISRLFPTARQHDEAAMTRIAEGRQAECLEDLEHMGTWLAYLSDNEDPLLRRRMLLRWWVACNQSTALGRGCFGLFKRFEPKFRSPDLRLNRACLRAACLLAIRPGGKIHHVARRMAKARSSRGAASIVP